MVAEQQEGRGPAAAEHQHRRGRADEDQPERKLFLCALLAFAFDGLVVDFFRIDVAVGYVLGHRVPNKLFSRPGVAALGGW